MTSAENESIPRPGDLEAEEESPYLRRQKTVAVRRRRVSHRLRWLLWGFVALVPLGLVGYELAAFALSSPLFVLGSPEDVVVVGNRFVSREEVVNALGFSLETKWRAGVNIFRLPLEAKRRDVEEIPWVRSAALTRAFPHRLVVQVQERAPVAFVKSNGRVNLLDADGVVLEKPENASFDFPVLTGWDVAQSSDDRQKRLALYTDFMRELGDEASHSGWLVSEVDLSDPDDLRALLVQAHETVQVHFGHQDFLERFRAFLMLLPELRKNSSKLDSVDLRYRDQVVVNPGQPAAESPPATKPAPPSGELKE
jgi:cell division protein FtsQ